MRYLLLTTSGAAKLPDHATLAQNCTWATSCSRPRVHVSLWSSLQIHQESVHPGCTGKLICSCRVLFCLFFSDRISVTGNQEEYNVAIISVRIKSITSSDASNLRTNLILSTIFIRESDVKLLLFEGLLACSRAQFISKLWLYYYFITQWLFYLYYPEACNLHSQQRHFCSLVHEKNESEAEKQATVMISNWWPVGRFHFDGGSSRPVWGTL